MPKVRITRLKLLLLGNLDEYGERILNYEVAAACRISPTQLGRYASGKREAFLQKDLLALADYFHVDPNGVIGWVDVEFPDYDEATG